MYTIGGRVEPEAGGVLKKKYITNTKLGQGGSQ